jgi:hypothetical protein
MGAFYLAVRADQQFEQKVPVKFATGALLDALAALAAASGNWKEAAGAEERAAALLEPYQTGPASDGFKSLRQRSDRYREKASH